MDSGTGVKTSAPMLGVEYQSALLEIRRQLDQAYALVSSARQHLVESDSYNAKLTPCQLLDMAEDVLGRADWINRLDDLMPKQEVNRGE